MKLDALQRLSRWLEKLVTVPRQIAEEVAVETTTSEQQRDPLALVVFQSPAHYRRAVEYDCSKHGARVAVTERESYKRAVTRGCRGSFAGCRDLLCAEQSKPSAQ